jgi:hypothetical protein
MQSPSSSTVLWLGGQPSVVAGELAALHAVGISLALANGWSGAGEKPSAIVIDTRPSASLSDLVAAVPSTFSSADCQSPLLHIGLKVCTESDAKHHNLVVSTVEFQLLIRSLIRILAGQSASASLHLARSASHRS